MKVGLIQANLAWNDPETNVKRAEVLALEAVTQGAVLIVLPEVFTTGFSMEAGAPAKKAGEAARAFLAKFAHDHGCWIAGSAPDAPDNDYARPYNTLLIFGPKGVVGSYQKQKLFSFAHEHDRYRAGSESVSVQLGEWRVSLFVCYDLRFPQLFAERANDTDLYLVVANWPTPRREHWRTLLRARAIENQAFIVGVNRVGTGGALHYSGDSMAIAPEGQIIVDQGNEERVDVVTLDRSEVTNYRSSFSALRDR